MALVSLIVLGCTLRSIRVAIRIIKMTADFVRGECWSAMIPFWMYMLLGGFLSVWVVVAVYIYSSGKVTSCEGSPYGCIEWDVGVKRCLGYYLVGLFWNCELAIAVSQFVLASVTGYWYFRAVNGHEGGISCRAIGKCYFRALVLQFGSLAFASLVLCLLFMLQLTLQLLHSLTKSTTMAPSPPSCIARCCVGCLRCLVACFERFIRFISKNAIVLMALNGSSFCTAAHEAFYLIARSSSAFAITHGVGSLIMLFGKLFVTAASTLIGYAILQSNIAGIHDNLYSPVLPIIIMATESWVVATIFMDVFAVGCDTILICYSIEVDIHKMPRLCPEELKSVIT